MGAKNEGSLYSELKNAIQVKHRIKVGELARLVEVGISVNEDDFVKELEALVNEGTIELKEPPYETRSMYQYLRNFNISGWFWACITLTGAALLAMAFVPSAFPFSMFRWVIASAFVLYLPGYVMIQFLFPKRGDFDGFERFLFSIGLSLVIVSFVGLVLNFLPWGIRLNPITMALTIFVLLVSFLAAVRGYTSLRETTNRVG